MAAQGRLQRPHHPSATSALSNGSTTTSPRSSSAACTSAKRSRDLQLTGCEHDPQRSQSPRSRPQIATHRPIDSADVSAELNLIGQTTADAEYELDRFLDEAYMSSLPRVRIIHGFGTGALKNYVHHFLKNSDLVERFEFAPTPKAATVLQLRN